MTIINKIATELKIEVSRVKTALQLMDEGNTKKGY